ncbi:DUF5684 domain-containing protein [Cellulomonas sp. McL0617]|uniref:DUF5684 domain-containing protein n=1 Tax=Cellulomonas sp. McL0617 TaxID=3415675 RepID=UPI003CF587CE
MHTLLSTVSTTSTTSSGATGLIFGIYLVAYIALFVIPMWVIFTKAGEAGWQSIIPIWNYIVLIKISGKPMWWIILFLIPIVNIVIWILVLNGLSASFGHGAGFTVGLFFLSVIFYYILAFDGSQYRGPGGTVAVPGGYATA